VTSERLARGALSLAWGLVAAVVAYALLRAIQVLRSSEANPAVVVWSPHAGFFWRAWTAAYIGGMAATMAALVSRGRVEAVARALTPAVAVAAGLLALVTALFP
jgi:hypothetical protein